MRSLYSKLAASLALILVLVGVMYELACGYIKRQNDTLVTQMFNQDLAQNLINENSLMKQGVIDIQALRTVFSEYMEINPGIEIYLLNQYGKILSFSAQPDKVKRDHVAVGPIRQFLDTEWSEPVLGDDPRGLDRQKPFSVAPIKLAGGLSGYLYVVLQSEAYDLVDHRLNRQYLLKLGLLAMVICLIIGLLAGLVILWFVTRPLRRLANQIDEYRGDMLSPKVRSRLLKSSQSSDEIGRLNNAFVLMSQRILDQFDALKNIDQKRRDLIAHVSHDLRTPAAATMGYLETLQMKSQSLPPEQREEYIEIALRNARRMSGLIDDLFELAKLEAKGVTLNTEPFSLQELVHDVTQQQRLYAEQQGINIKVDAPEKLPFVIGDIALIQRVLENLMSNAVTHVGREGKIVISLRANDSHVTVRVWDNGAQIDPKDLPLVFDRFYQGAYQGKGETQDHNQNDNAGRDERRKGAGLGLSIARQILALHKSRIKVSREANQGKVFTFNLRVA